MKTTKLLFLMLLFCHQLDAQTDVAIIKSEKLVIGDRIELKSKILNENRILNIYLPSGYSSDSVKQYPVIYLLDGSLDEDFIHIAGIVQFGSFSWIDMIPESIVVGIGNTDRKRDFTYPSGNELDRKEFPTSGKSAHFISFIEKELQPYIDGAYRTTDISTIIGQSLGGLLATEILLSKPELFDHYIIVSPSLWWDDEKILDTPSDAGDSVRSVYVAVGKEGEVMERTARELYDRIKKDTGQNTRVYYHFLEDKTHGDALHLAVYHAFETIFNPEHR
jgi:predicted alpha/beta superfamily hydrolase